jgi:restriction system protein
MQVQILDVIGQTNEGAVIKAAFIPWQEILKSLQRNPEELFEICKDPRRFEELIAAAYEKDGWDRVVLTPRSGDGGRDVIAEKSGFGSLRFLDQCKAFKRGHLVGHDDIRAMLGVLHSDHRANKAIVSTTSDFAPGVLTDQAIMKHVPTTLELRNGNALVDWFSRLPS